MAPYPNKDTPFLGFPVPIPIVYLPIPIGRFLNIQLAGQTVREILDSCGHVASSGIRSTGTSKEWVIDQLELRHLLGRNVEELSGGELQRLAVSQIALMDAGGLNLVVFVSPTQVSVETIGCG